ncbi:MAG: Wzz/FepE/Etk N-terminal domain-containing protein [Melioribacteraceae bacterium]
MNINKIETQNKTFTDFIIILLKWYKIIFWNVFIITTISLIISFLVPKWYTSTASIIPPKSSGGLLGDITNISSTIKDLSKSLGKLGSVSNEAYSFLAILESRTSFEKVIKKFNLRSVYEFDSDDYIEEVIQKLESNVEVNVADEGNINIKVTDEDPRRAADIAAYFVELLNEISTELGTYEARNNREFIEKRYLQCLDDLEDAEDSLKVFSEKYSVYSISDQTKASISAASELKAKIEIEKIELNLMKKNFGDNSPFVRDKEIIIMELGKRLYEFKYTNEKTKNDISFFTPFSELPQVGIKLLRLKADYELQTKILEFILPVYEQAKIEEKKDIPVCLLLDKPVPAEKKAGPKKAIIVGAAFLISLFLSIILSLILESIEDLKKNTSSYNKINQGIYIPLKKIFSIK